MSILSQKEPKEVFRFFEEICGIPHGSGNIEQISNYLADFAKERNLFCIQDEVKNIIIIKEATEGYENEEPVLIQGHMDMVAVKTPGCTKDMTKEGLDLEIDGDYLSARDTTLGGDDGIAVAYALALLDSDSIPHPRLEVVITVDEETGMEGANAIDLSVCKGKRLLNLDSEEEGIFLTSCAGGARIHGILPVETEEKEGVLVSVSVEGLAGGHSGAEIDKERGNANCLMGRFLSYARKDADVRAVSMKGGVADNAIPREASADFFVEEKDLSTLKNAVARFDEIVKNELAVKDKEVKVTIKEEKKGKFQVLTEDSTKKAALLLFLLPAGVQSMSADIPGLVQTSLNLGILKLDGKEMHLDYSVRSSLQSEKEMLLDKVSELIAFAGGSSEVSGDYPAWEYKKDSVLREKMIAVYQEMFGEMPQIEAIHAGLECGILAGKIKDLDCVSIGPEMHDIHTTEERLSISSVERMWKFILEVLARKDK